MTLDEIKILPRSGYGLWEDNSLDSTSIKSERPYGIDERFLVATKDYKCGLCNQIVRKGQYHFHNHKRPHRNKDRNKIVMEIITPITMRRFIEKNRKRKGKQEQRRDARKVRLVTLNFQSQ
jgi:hypothetical protein